MDVDSYIENAVKEAQTILNELVGLSVSRKHVSFGFGPNVLEYTDRIKLEKNGYKLGKGTMQIQFGQPVPVVAIKKFSKRKFN